MMREQAYPFDREMRVKQRHFAQNHEAAATQDVKSGSSHFG